jgi:hypothetical protein
LTVDTLLSVASYGKNGAVAVGRDGAAIYTTDAGKTWKLDSTGSTVDLNEVTIAGSSFAVAVGVEGAILQKKFVLDPTDVAVEVDVPQGYALYSNYPNPFNPSTVIGYQLPAGGNVRLEVVDVLGREVAALVDEWKEAGVHQAMFDAAGLSGGVYYYRLRVRGTGTTNGGASRSGSGDFVATKSMVLIR